MNLTEWYKFFGVASKVYDKYKHLDIPYNAETRSGIKLGQWLEEQRQNIGELSSGQINDLISIGMIWTIERGDFHDKFTQYKDELLKYSVYDKDSGIGLKLLNLNKDSIAKDGFNLYEWSKSFETLRELKDDRYMSVAEIGYLSEIGFRWKNFDIRKEETKHKQFSTDLVEELMELQKQAEQLNRSTGISKEKKVKWHSESMENTKDKEEVNAIAKETLLKIINKYTNDIKNELKSATKQIKCLSIEVEELKRQIEYRGRTDIKSEGHMDVDKRGETQTGTKYTTFDRRMELLTQIVDERARIENIDRRFVVLHRSAFAGTVETQRLYPWILSKAKYKNTLTTYNVNRILEAYPSAFDKSIASLGMLDYDVDAYIELASKELMANGYVSNYIDVSSEIYKLAYKLSHIEYEKFNTEQISKLEAVKFIWLNEGGSKIALSRLKTYETNIQLIVKNKITKINTKDVKSALYVWVRETRKDAQNGNIVAQRIIGLVDEYLEKNRELYENK